MIENRYLIRQNNERIFSSSDRQKQTKTDKTYVTYVKHFVFFQLGTPNKFYMKYIKITIKL